MKSKGVIGILDEGVVFPGMICDVEALCSQ